MSYPGVRALDGIDLDLFAHEVHGLVGENGAGKSTLLKIASGAISPSTGTVRLDGDAVGFAHPLAAKAAGVVAVHQELAIIPTLSALANVLLGQEVSRWGFFRRREMLATFASLSAQLEVTIDPHCQAGSLSIADQQSLEIMRGLVADARVLIFDEPTASIGVAEREALYEIIRRLKARGVAVLYISHDLSEVLTLSDRITVLRDGLVVGTRPTAGWSKDALVVAMLGKRPEVGQPVGAGRAVAEGEALRVQDVSVPGKVRNVSFSVRSGEILGIAGLVGSGRTEVLRAIVGLDRRASGTLSISGKEVRLPQKPHAALRLGIALAPEDRKVEGLCLGLPAYANVTLTDPWKPARYGLLGSGREVATARPAAEAVALQAGALTRSARALSGGNQQKVVLAKWLETRVRVLLVDEPTRGVDVGAKTEIFTALRALAARGVAIVLVSSELEEVMAHSDRCLVLSRGTLIGEYPAGASTDDVLRLILETDAGQEDD